MESPLIRPGKVSGSEATPRVIAFFHNSALGNSAIQYLTCLGVPNDRLGVTPPERIPNGQGMILSIGCPDEKMLPKVESACRKFGAEVRRQWNPN